MRTMKTQQGYSMVEILLVLGIMASIAVGSTSLLRDQMVGQNTFRFKEGLEVVTQESKSYLRSSEACLNTMTGVNLNLTTDQPIQAIRDEVNNPVYASAGVYQDRTVRLARAMAKPHLPITATKGRILLELEFERISEVFGPERVTRSIQIFTERDAGNALTSCKAKLNSEQGPWKKITDSKINTLKKIGIGTSNPLAALDIKNGKLRGQLECRRVTGPPMVAWSEAVCASDEWVVGGGGYCDDPRLAMQTSGLIHSSQPMDGLTGWSLDCWKVDQSQAPWDITLANSVAICCKK